MSQRIIFFFSLILFLFLVSCKKSSFLDVKPNEKLGVPETLEDLQAILDYDKLMNGDLNSASFPDPSYLMAGVDDYYVPPSNFRFIRSPEQKNMYIWNDSIFLPGVNPPAWEIPYTSIFYANVALDGLKKIKLSSEQKTAYDNIRGSALFYRARLFFQLAQVFAPPYNRSTADKDWGIVLRLTGDLNESIKRSTVEQTYQQIINDLKSAVDVLPEKPLYTTRPSKPAAYALLAKTYLILKDYEAAQKYSDASLKINDELLDFNTLDTVSTQPVIKLSENPEILHFTMLNQELIFSAGFFSRIDSMLYRSYDPNDLRKKVFFNAPADNDVYYKGSYAGSYFYFSGIATDEVFLIRAEANANLGNTQLAMDDLNTLLSKRWRTGKFSPLTANDKSEALRLILRERRKELVGRGTRWSDLRRLNQDGANITITRILDNVVYTLPPDSKKYTYLIPPDIMALHPEMPQNVR